MGIVFCSVWNQLTKGSLWPVAVNKNKLKYFLISNSDYEIKWVALLSTTWATLCVRHLCGETLLAVKLLSCVWPLATPWTAAYQAPPSMGVSWQEYWSGVPFPSLQAHRRCLINTHFCPHPWAASWTEACEAIISSHPHAVWHGG